MPITPLDAAGMQRLRDMRGKGKKKSSEKEKKGKKNSEGKEKKALVKEHVKLVSVLKGAKPKAVKTELMKQEKELAMLKKKK
jgi:hypothetical protein